MCAKRKKKKADEEAAAAKRKKAADEIHAAIDKEWSQCESCKNGFAVNAIEGKGNCGQHILVKTGEPCDCRLGRCTVYYAKIAADKTFDFDINNMEPPVVDGPVVVVHHQHGADLH